MENVDKQITNTNSVISIATMSLLSILILYFSIDAILSFIDNNTRFYLNLIRENKIATNIVLVLLLVIILIFRNRKHPDFMKIWKGIIVLKLLTYVLSIIVCLICGNSKFWIFEYSIGIFCGIIVSILNRKLNYSKASVTAGIVALVAIMIGNKFEYLRTMEPPVHPSLFYINSFPNVLFWLLALMIILIPAAFILNFVKYLEKRRT